ncbi:MAG: S-layer homology domain-containing protein [Clostridia bacterium]|nr:S-layer homology domain-containing protein [Clostridia bacterium]
MKKRVLSLIMVIGMMLSMAAAAVDYAPKATAKLNGNTYYMFDESMTWDEARAYCEALEGHLVTITSEEEQKLVESLLEQGEKKQYWIGMRTAGGGNTWITGEACTYSNWDRGEPNNKHKTDSNEDYVHIYNVANPAVRGSERFKWNDMFGDNTYPGEENHFALKFVGFICEWEYVRSSFGSEISGWAEKEIETAYDKQLIPEALVGKDLTQPITRAEFAAVSVKAYEAIADVKTKAPAIENPFSDTEDENVLKAYEIGIITGTGDGTTFSPSDLLNREQASTMLTRVYKKCFMEGWTIEKDAEFVLEYEKPAPFSDDDKISLWAKDSVYFMAANKIIQGSEGKFMPKAVTDAEKAIGYAQATREQALIIATRMVENLK